MHNFQGLTQTQSLMFIYLCVGYLCRKLGYTDETTENKFSMAITNIVLPCMIFNAVLTTLNDVIIADVLLVSVICIASVLLSYGFGWILYRKAPNGKRPVLIYSVLASNSSFVGLPMIAAVYGDQGIFYATIYITIARVFDWTMGLNLFIQAGKGLSFRRVATNINNIAAALAVLIHVLGIHIPAPVSKAVAEIGGTTTFLCMVMVGSLIASNFHWRKLLYPVAYGYSAVRLLILPVLHLILLQIVNIDPLITGSVVFLVSSPAPTMACIMATRYGADKDFATTLILVSTLLSFITQPLIAFMCK